MYRDKPSREELRRIAEDNIERLIDLIDMLYEHNVRLRSNSSISRSY